MYTKTEKEFLLKLARRSIEHFFDAGALLPVGEEGIAEKLRETRACFVTLTMGGNLRGCIGHIQAVQPLYLDVIENAVAAAFDDPRFAPLTRAEYLKVNIEISVLDVPNELTFFSAEDLLQKLRPGVDGVIIRRGAYGATYLPQVWEEIPNKEEFLSSLCQKAGLPADDWRKRGLTVKIYGAEKITERAIDFGQEVINLI